MPFRTVIIDTHSKIEYSQNYLVYKTPQIEKRILLDEVHTIIIQSTEVSVTSSLLVELSKRKIKTIFCDEKRNPSFEIASYYGCHNSSKRIQEQINWTDEKKNIVWKEIVKEKILNQSKSLSKKGKSEEAKMLIEYSDNIEDGDTTNREGFAAKVYFNIIFYPGFTRNDDSAVNKYLNYGYSILLSQFNRSIVSYGYLTQIGIHHKNEFNSFNLACDLMEPFRFLIDDYVTELTNDNYKEKLIGLLASNVKQNNEDCQLTNAINNYVISVFNALNDGDIKKIKFINND